MASKYNTDSKFERSSIQYLKNKDIFEDLDMVDVVWTDDEETQKTGSDLIATIKGEANQVVDIKSVAFSIPTFSQEIINGKSEKVGWIMNNELATDYLLFVWHNVNADNYTDGKLKIIKDLSCINYTDISLCKKKDMQDLIYKEIGIKCNDKAANFILSEIKRINSKKSISYYTVDRDNKCLREIEDKSKRNIYISYSKNIHERPINFIVRKSLINSISKNIRVF